MKKDRYALVKVNYMCPSMTRENIICIHSWKGNCIGCHFLDSKNGGSKNYGDTREQLINKIYQIIQRESTKGPIWGRNLAEEIVTSLGVIK